MTKTISAAPKRPHNLASSAEVRYAGSAGAAPTPADAEADRPGEGPGSEDAASTPGLAAADGTDGASTLQPSREDRIRLAAYLAAERRGFAPGLESQDWVEAERQIDAE